MDATCNCLYGDLQPDFIPILSLYISKYNGYDKDTINLHYSFLQQEPKLELLELLGGSGALRRQQ